MTGERIRLTSPDGTLSATFVPELGMICPSLRLGERELLAKVRGLEDYAAQGKTMGIPLLYPWANRLAHSRYLVAGRETELPNDPGLITRDPHELPLHGVLPSRMQWTAELAPGGARLEAWLHWGEEPLIGVFPFRHDVRLEAELSNHALTVTTTVTAAAEDPVPVSFGFHPYLRLPGERSECRVSLPAAFRLTLDEWGIPTGGRAPLEPREFALLDTSWDAGLALEDPRCRFSVTGPDGARSVELLEGFSFGQIFAPPGSEFICFEPMTAPANALISGDGLPVLNPGEAHRARFRITVSDLG